MRCTIRFPVDMELMDGVLCQVFVLPKTFSAEWSGIDVGHEGRAGSIGSFKKKKAGSLVDVRRRKNVRFSVV